MILECSGSTDLLKDGEQHIHISFIPKRNILKVTYNADVVTMSAAAAFLSTKAHQVIESSEHADGINESLKVLLDEILEDMEGR